ncbi:outer membrane protein assembly factor BamB family protein [Micromonospora sp. LZ34]
MAEFVDLGSMYTANVRLAAMDVRPDGTPVVYGFSDGTPVSFNAIDARTGKLLHTTTFPRHTVASSIVVDDSGLVYLSVRAPNDGTLWRYDPATNQVTQIATRVVGEAMLRTLLIKDDIVYGTTYPEAKVYSYDPASGDFRDYGALVTDGDYAWGFDQVDGKLWIGTGAIPHLFSLDPATGDKTEIPLPEPVATQASFINRITRHGDLVFVQYSPTLNGQNHLVYDLSAGRWCCTDTVGQPIGFGHITRGSVDGRFFYASDDTVHGYDITTRETVPVGWEDSPLAAALGTTRAFEPMHLGTPEFPGTTLVGMRGDGTIWRYNLQNRTGDILPNVIQSTPATVHSVGTGPDGNVYFGAYLSAGVMARVDRATGELEQLSGPKQADSITTHDNRIVVGTYPGAEYYAGQIGGDTTWDWGRNPRHLFSLGRAELGQDRPVTLVSAGDLVVGGTVSDYGELGGGLVVFDPATGEHQFHRNVVPDQSVTALATVGGLVIGGTSIHGGLSSTPTRDRAELFIWDVAAGEKVWSAPVVGGGTIVQALTVGPHGMVWGLTEDGTVFEFDPRTRTVTRSFDAGFADGNLWGLRTELFYRAADARFYGNAGGKLFWFDPRTLERGLVVERDVRISGMDRDGTIYIANNTNVFRWEPADDPRDCDASVTGTHDGPLRVTAGKTCVTDAVVNGPIQVGPGASVRIEDSHVHGGVTTDQARVVSIVRSRIDGSMSITGTNGSVLLSGNTINGALACAENGWAPTDDGVRNAVAGPASGQCAGLKGEPS